MTAFLYVIQILLCVALIAVVLMQSGRGSGLAGFVSDSMGQSMFGGSGGRPFFIKLTTGLAVVFMLICLLQAWMTAHQGNQYQGVLSGYHPTAAQSAPANPAPNQPAGQSNAGSSAPHANPIQAQPKPGIPPAESMPASQAPSK